MLSIWNSSTKPITWDMNCSYIEDKRVQQPLVCFVKKGSSKKRSSIGHLRTSQKCLTTSCSKQELLTRWHMVLLSQRTPSLTCSRGHCERVVGSIRSEYTQNYKKTLVHRDVLPLLFLQHRSFGAFTLKCLTGSILCAGWIAADWSDNIFPPRRNAPQCRYTK